MFFSQWHRHTRKKKNLSAPNRSRIYMYDLAISTSDALPLSYRRLVVARPLNYNLGQNKKEQLTSFPPKAMMKSREDQNPPF